ncbi:UNVERIFIED_CONTAM: hypothetical protein GTU68_051165 [Idotea baltica]|nr:hypothetical protein [Idotea baltica]
MEARPETFIDLLKQLIATPSLSKEEDNTADIIEEFFTSRSIKVERIKNNIIVRNQYFDSDKPTILLNSHHDTVKPNISWKKDPFYPLVEDGKLYGLGSNDAGGCLVSLIAAFVYFYEQQNLKYNLILAATAEEEISGKNGVELIIPKLGDIDFAIVGEPTFVVDVRSTDAYSNDEILEIISTYVDCEVVPRSTRLQPSGLPENHVLHQCAMDLNIKTYGSPTLSDQALMPFPSVKIGPGDSARSHTADEYIGIDEIEEGIALYIKLLSKILG